MSKVFSYFPISVVIIIAFGAVFYILTAEKIIFWGAEKSVPRSILPSLSDSGIEKAIIDEMEKIEEETVEQETSFIPAPRIQPKGEVRPAPIQNPEPPPSNERGQETHIISMDRDGFNARTLVIIAGDTVKWVNNDTRLHWPASDPHPTHTGLSGFDPLADLLPGESFSFTFNSPGVYGYHDHTLAVVAGIATLTGVIRVLPSQ